MDNVQSSRGLPRRGPEIMMSLRRGGKPRNWSRGTGMAKRQVEAIVVNTCYEPATSTGDPG